MFRSIEIELNFIEKGPKTIIYEPISAAIALASTVSFLKLVLKSSSDRLQELKPEYET
jgi:hypothetical protein